jgi:hypothetical protein
MTNPAVILFRRMIEESNTIIAEIQDQIVARLPNSPAQLNAMHNVQHMLRDNIDTLQESIKEFVPKQSSQQQTPLRP